MGDDQQPSASASGGDEQSGAPASASGDEQQPSAPASGDEQHPSAPASGDEQQPSAPASGDEQQPSAPASGPASSGGPGAATVPDGLVSAVVHLVDTGPVMLGAYTIAELTAVDAVVDFLEARPSDEVLAEAVRSLAARQLLVPGSSQEQVQVRGDLGIAVAFQQRARKVLDARVAGTQPGEPWRILVLPQPERICLVVRIDALGVHEIALHKQDDTLEMLADWLPHGSPTHEDTATSEDALLTDADRSALVTLTDYMAQGSAETAVRSKDLLLAARKGHLRAMSRERADGDESDGELKPITVDGKDGVRDRLGELLTAA